jgi:hypothetical protein
MKKIILPHCAHKLEKNRKSGEKREERQRGRMEEG